MGKTRVASSGQSQQSTPQQEHSSGGGTGNAMAQADLETNSAPQGGASYTVVRGDTLWGIAQRAYGQGSLWTRIRDANSDKVFRGGHLILVGTELCLPSVDTSGGEQAGGEQSGGEGQEQAEGGEGGQCGGEEGGLEAALEPRIEDTDYGNYAVYPDEVPMSLMPAARTDDQISMLESDFQSLKHLMDGIVGGTSGININGNDTYRAGVLSDFGWLMSQGVGRDLFSAIIASGKNLTINRTTGGNSCGYSPDADSWENADGTPGAGANITVSYNTANWNPYGGSAPWMTRPPAIGLAHELVHAWTGMTGTRALGETAEGVNRRELQATGLGEFEDNALTENKFRAAFGLPLRPRY